MNLTAIENKNPKVCSAIYLLNKYAQNTEYGCNTEVEFID